MAAPRLGVFLFFGAVAVLSLAAAAAAASRGGGRSTAYDDQPCDGAHCKPSFLIIGIGKCGTSSLYYYLVGHPKVKPATQKQIQWFDHAYASARFASSYLSHFPTTLGPGEITGEASPGYAQYTSVPGRVAAHLAGVRILCIARDPAERAYSSYYYNYVTSAGASALPFDVLVDAEIDFLEKFFRRDARRRGCGAGAACRHDLSADCYGRSTAEEQVGRAARRYADARPGKIALAKAMPRANQHLWRQLVGRSLYAANLDWWYAAHKADDILLVCSEDLGAPDRAADEMARVAAFLGLEAFDFGPVVGKGKYNAGSAHRGYEAVTKWDDAEAVKAHRAPMDEAARAAIANFTRPFNARLFDLAGHACGDWGLGGGGGAAAAATRARPTRDLV